MNEQLARFEAEVLYNVLLGNTSPKVTDKYGDSPIVACLDSEPLAVLVERVKACGGDATIYSLGDDGATIRVVASMSPECAISDEVTDMTGQPPSGLTSVGLFIDYVESQADGILVPEILPSARIRSYGHSDLVELESV